jgi:hypothetical protein
VDSHGLDLRRRPAAQEEVIGVSVACGIAEALPVDRESAGFRILWVIDSPLGDLHLAIPLLRR